MRYVVERVFVLRVKFSTQSRSILFKQKDLVLRCRLESNYTSADFSDNVSLVSTVRVNR